MTPETLAFFHLVSYVLTWTSSRIGRHSPAHMFLAEAALAGEVVGMYAAWGWMVGWAWARTVAITATVYVVLCMVAVALTDRWWRKTLRKVLDYAARIVHDA